MNFAEIGGTCNMHHWLGGMGDPAHRKRLYTGLLLRDLHKHLDFHVGR